MKSNNVGKYRGLSILGFLILAAGLFLVLWLPEEKTIFSAVPFVMIGVGAGIFGGSFGSLIKIKLLQGDPRAARQMEIDSQDERNIAINNRAKAKAYDLMMMVYGALLLAFALMQVEAYLLLALVAVYLFVICAMVYFSHKYNKEM